jgi:KDO2-lipid IV(A) lauroyltransferase
MTNIKYFLQFIAITFLFSIFKLLGIKISSLLSGKLLALIGPLFRSKKICISNLSIAFPELENTKKEKILRSMWFNYGRMLAEYMFINKFRNSNLSNNIIIENQEELNRVKNSLEPVIFISGHFNNFELMAMHLEKSGIKLAAIYRPLNNIFLNPLMEKIRKKYICKNQIKKGMAGTKEILKFFKKKTSIALMVDQRVSEGIQCNFFNKPAFTTTIPAQFAKKYNAKIVPIYIERIKNNNFKIKVYKSLQFSKEESLENITLGLNKILEDMIIKNPEQWIWTHGRWK